MATEEASDAEASDAARSEEARAAADGEPTAVHGGRLVARTLRSRGVENLFTLSGGHLFSIYDGCREEGIRLVDTRHEQGAAWAAEGWAKATRKPGVCGLTAGPGVTNAISAVAGAQQNGSPLVVLGGRAPQMRWGSGSLQEIDHVPVLASLTKSAQTVTDTAEIPAATAAAIDTAAALPSGPTFLDFPLDVVFMEAAADPPPAPELGAAPPAERAEKAAAILAAAERPVIMAGTGLYWARAEQELGALAEGLGIAVFLNGMGRGCLAADHALAFSRARRKGLKEADVALVVGVPLDFRLGFGDSFGEETKLIQLDVEPSRLQATRRPELALVGDIAATLSAIREVGESARRAAGRAAGPGSAAPEGSGAGGAARAGDRGRGGAAGVTYSGPTRGWLDSLREAETEAREAERGDLSDERAPLHPLRIYGELRELLDRDAIVIGDGGDFVSYAGRVIETYEPGCWMDPGPYGCLGAGPGQAIGAAVARPGRQICVLLGDGAFGFSGLEFDTMVRHGLPVVGVIGNNGIWGLEKHPMEFLYGYSVAAELRPETRYDEVVEALGGHGELVREPAELRGALERAFACGGPALVNVLTDPEVVYPRRAVLA
jgi:acetolactate synthase-1/2/3 large subunit